MRGPVFGGENGYLSTEGHGERQLQRQLLCPRRTRRGAEYGNCNVYFSLSTEDTEGHGERQQLFGPRRIV